MPVVLVPDAFRLQALVEGKPYATIHRMNHPSICVASHHDSVAALVSDAEFADLAARPPGAFLIELRLDRYADLTPEALDAVLNRFGPGKLVVTYRSVEEGGARPEVSDAERGKYLERAARRGAAFVDLELHTIQRAPEIWKVLQDARAAGSTRLVVSYHDFERVPPRSRLRDFREDAEAVGADVVKLAVTPATILESAALLELLREDRPGKPPLLALGMGEAGLWTRVLGPRFPRPAPFTFARGAGAPGTAPGQPTWRELHELYRFGALTSATRLYGVIGNPIGHSLSPRMHNAALQAAGLDAVYLPFRVDGDPLAFLQTFAEPLGLEGVSVTIPHKQAVMPGCAELDPLAISIGAVNTLVRRPNGWYGTNTDAPAAADSLEAALGGKGTLRGRKVLLLGAGGAARALAYAVHERGAEVRILNRSAEKAQELAAAVQGACVSKEDLDRADFHVDVAINTTPLGMHPHVDASPLTEAQVCRADLIFDTVYNPFRTQVLQYAERQGRKTLGGLGMFVGQGALQFALYTGRPAPLDVMEAAVREALAARKQE